MKVFCQLGKTGDVISILGILYHEFLATGQKQILVIGREFSEVLEGVSYVEPVIWKGEAGDLAGAILFAKKRFSQVTVLQTWANNMPIQQITPSFQLDQWSRAGFADRFFDYPTVFDRRDTETKVLDMNGKPYILFGDHSRSSPFLYKEELAAMLKAEFPKHEIVRLSEHRMPHICDFLPLFDGAAALVTVETAHVHLSKASTVPTFVLAADGWRGSAWHPKFKLHMRYAAWKRRKDKLIDSVRRAVNGEPEPFQVNKFGTDFPDAYNPSILEFEGRTVTIYRYHDRNDWRTALACDDGYGEEFRLVSPLPKEYSLEDARLFELGGNIHAAYVASTVVDREWRSYVAYGEIRDGHLGHVQVQYNGNDFRGMTKNWVPFVHDDVLHLLYGIKGNDQIVLRVDGNRVQAEYNSPGPTWAWGQIRGGAIVPHEGKLLRFFHSRVGEHAAGKYFIGASLMDASPPFKTEAVSSKPVIEGDERWTADCPHWKANCALPFGAIKRDGKFLLSYGRNDCEPE